MNKPFPCHDSSHSPGAPETPANRPAFAWWIPAGAWLTAALADWLFYDRPAGWTIGLFSSIVLLAILFLPGSMLFGLRRAAKVLATVIGGLCLRCIYEPNILSVFGIIIGLLSLGLMGRDGSETNAWIWVRRWSKTLFLGWAQSALRLGASFVAPLRHLGGTRPGRVFHLWLVPGLLGVVFLSLFAVANPVMGNTFSKLWDFICRQHFPQPDPVRFLFWLAVATAFATLTTYATGIRSGTQPSKPQCMGVDFDQLIGGILSPSAVRRALILFNLLFGVQTTLDLIYLWGGAALPDNLTYAEYAQRGAYPLVAAALLAGAFALAAFRPGTDGGNPRLERRLVYLWLGQTLLLVASSAWRLWLYVGAYTLTRLRFAAAIWMLLVALGLVWITVRIARQRTGKWLVNVNLSSAAAVLYLCAWTGSDRAIAWFNIRHCEEVLGPGHPALDVGYLEKLGIEALLPLVALTRQYPGHDHADRWRTCIDVLSEHLVPTLEWRGWTLRRGQILVHLKTGWLGETENEFFSFGQVVAVRPDSLRVREYDFAGDCDAEFEYHTTTNTGFGDIAQLADLNPGDSVVMDYSLDGTQRVVMTLVLDTERELEDTPMPIPLPDPVGTFDAAAIDSGPPLPAPLAPKLAEASPPPYPASPDATIVTGRVAALVPGAIVLKEPGDTPGTFETRRYIVARRAQLHGLTSLTEVKTEQPITCRVIHPNGKPTIIELAVRGYALSPSAP